jgi:hypothetical protein
MKTIAQFQNYQVDADKLAGAMIAKTGDALFTGKPITLAEPAKVYLGRGYPMEISASDSMQRSRNHRRDAEYVARRNGQKRALVQLITV